MNHTCSIPTCGKELPLNLLMCRSHWTIVPYKLRRKVFTAWDGYCNEKVTIEELRKVQQRATAYVCLQLGEPEGGTAA